MVVSFAPDRYWDEFAIPYIKTMELLEFWSLWFSPHSGSRHSQALQIFLWMSGMGMIGGSASLCPVAGEVSPSEV